ncbi:dystroglycan 1-like [Dreissena polymorpha]|uniref:Dystroglycan 1 n=1 Tax=Dreissena polymorpha TaxID=45954 RepID=A0A9D4JPG8_DREPO|nr:dystroglycan 1-like [Dreissena polymorpha]XP_052285684.1 dystroglycan 1-like [Dreissena polymorpha]XP_052285685.1 dystroglycan 1-like [Dreissena polymorpha]KAH3819740.1 hypothetical protein DPMN_121483 [Dreissena polymorpha]
MTLTLTFLVALTLVVTLEAKNELHLENVTAIVGHKFEYLIGNEEFLKTYRVIKVVEKGHRTMPAWLEFDTTSSLLTGMPGPSDLGEVAMRIRAECINASTLICQEKISRTFHITVVEPLRVAESRAAPDQPPYVNQSIDHLEVTLGRYFEFNVRPSTFLDREDGDTRNLSLAISLMNGRPLPNNSWLLLDLKTQSLFGIPYADDGGRDTTLKRFILTATDSQEQSVKDVISISYKHETKITHKFMLTLNSSVERYLTASSDYRRYLSQVARNIGKYFNDIDLRYFTFFYPGDGLSMPYVWGNNSLFTDECQKQDIQSLFDRIMHENYSFVPEFASRFQSESPPDLALSAELFFFGACLVPRSTDSPIQKTAAVDNAWMEVVLPALIAILAIIILAIVLLICCRHRRATKRVAHDKPDKPMFLEDRRPIIFPEELEMLDPSRKPMSPIVLPADYLRETPPAVPPHGRPSPAYPPARSIEDESYLQTQGSSVPQGHYREQTLDPPPYRLPPPYFNPHRYS